MARFTALPARSLSTNAGFLEAAKPARPKLSKGYNLPAKFIIHTVGPVWNGGDSDEERLLASCYSESLAIAESHAEIDSIAFPCISTGIFGFPAEAAARIAVESCKNATLSVTFCCFSQKDLGLYRALLAIS